VLAGFSTSSVGHNKKKKHFILLKKRCSYKIDEMINIGGGKQKK
jgi:hypothetical protein